MPHALLAYQTPSNLEDVKAHCFAMLNVINHKGIPSGEASLQMELCVNSSFLSSFP